MSDLMEIRHTASAWECPNMVMMIAVQSIPRTLAGADSAAISAVNTCLAADTDTMGTDGTGDV